MRQDRRAAARPPEDAAVTGDLHTLLSDTGRPIPCAPAPRDADPFAKHSDNPRPPVAGGSLTRIRAPRREAMETGRRLMCGRGRGILQAGAGARAAATAGQFTPRARTEPEFGGDRFRGCPGKGQAPKAGAADPTYADGSRRVARRPGAGLGTEALRDSHDETEIRRDASPAEPSR